VHTIFQKLKHKLVVSCQAEGDSPFNSIEGVTLFAESARMGGAAAIRTEGLERVAAIRKKVGLPVIGLMKSSFEDGTVKITGSEREVISLLEAGCDVIAVDGTFRKREGRTGPEFIQYLKEQHKVMLMADISNTEEALACYEADADCISTTLSGYTSPTMQTPSSPDIELVETLTGEFSHKVPIFAEGRYNTPELAAKAIEAGAWSVVVGSAITRPQVITKWFCDAVEQ